MAILKEYHKPQSVAEALQLLGRTDIHLVALAGGSQLVGALETRARLNVDGVVDLAALGLDQIEEDDGALQVGAMVTVSELLAQPRAGALADGLLSRAARGEGPINWRNQATIGGLVASPAHDSELAAALLVLSAAAVVADGQQVKEVPLSALFAQGMPSDRLITAIRIPLAAGRGGHARVARTLSDRPIVAALAVIEGETERVALCGVAPYPILAGTSAADYGDFKGSVAYRQAMADVVAQRAVREAKQER